MSKIRTRQCARCGKQQRTGNGYCAPCNAIRMAESRGKIPMPETEEGKLIRDNGDDAFALLDRNPGAEVTVQGIKMQSDPDGSGDIAFPDLVLNREQKRELLQRLQSLKEGI